jgi:hypothetical protein
MTRPAGDARARDLHGRLSRVNGAPWSSAPAPSPSRHITCRRSRTAAPPPTAGGSNCPACSENLPVRAMHRCDLHRFENAFPPVRRDAPARSYVIAGLTTSSRGEQKQSKARSARPTRGKRLQPPGEPRRRIAGDYPECVGRQFASHGVNWFTPSAQRGVPSTGMRSRSAEASHDDKVAT